LYLSAASMPPCFSSQPHKMRFANNSLHILYGDCYTQIENEVVMHLVLDAQGKQYVLSSIFNQS
jgi:hypothetical protein